MPPKAGKKTAGKAKAAPKSNHQLAERFPPGEVLTDWSKGNWRLGEVIGSGGFGLIYLASSMKDPSKHDYVVKIEPHTNGPLFAELKFYQNCCQPDAIKQWMSSKKVSCLGVPRFIASGNHTCNNSKYRFMVMERFGSDLQKKFEACGKVFPKKTILILAEQIIDSLEYIHSRKYVHLDIKASNMLLGCNKGNQNQAYLVDYGLAAKYEGDQGHKEYKEDPRRCHDGTIEFTSRDAHKGVVAPSRRADMEILGYCLLQWHCSRLPWEDKLDNPNYVRDQKIRYMDDIPALLKTCFPKKTPPAELKSYLTYVSDLDYAEQPDYNKCRKFFREAYKAYGIKNDGAFTFTSEAEEPSTSRKRKSISPLESPPKRQARRSATPESSPKLSKSSTLGIVPGLSPSKQEVRAATRVTPKGKRKANARSPALKVKAKKRSPVVKSKAAIKTSSSAAGHGVDTPAMREVRASRSSSTASPVARQAMLANSDPHVPNGTSTNCIAIPSSAAASSGRAKVSKAVQTSPHLQGLRGKRHRVTHSRSKD